MRASRISASALHQLQKLYESAERSRNSDEITNENLNNKTTEEPLSVHHLPKAALDILQQPNNPQYTLQLDTNETNHNNNNKNNTLRNNSNKRSKEKIDSITRDLSNVDLD